MSTIWLYYHRRRFWNEAQRKKSKFHFLGNLSARRSSRVSTTHHWVTLAQDNEQFKIWLYTRHITQTVMTLDSVTLSNQPNSRPKHKISSSVEKKCVTNSPFSDGWKPLFCVPLSSEWERDTQTRNRSSRTTWASQRHGVKCWGQHKKRIWRWLWVFVLCVRLANARRRQQWWQKYSASPWARQCFHYFTIFSHFWLRNSMVAVSFFFFSLMD